MFDLFSITLSKMTRHLSCVESGGSKEKNRPRLQRYLRLCCVNIWRSCRRLNYLNLCLIAFTDWRTAADTRHTWNHPGEVWKIRTVISVSCLVVNVHVVIYHMYLYGKPVRDQALVLYQQSHQKKTSDDPSEHDGDPLSTNGFIPPNRWAATDSTVRSSSGVQFSFRPKSWSLKMFSMSTTVAPQHHNLIVEQQHQGHTIVESRHGVWITVATQRLNRRVTPQLLYRRIAPQHLDQSRAAVSRVQLVQTCQLS